VRTVADVIAAYVADCENPYSERRKRKDVDGIKAHFIPTRALWGDMTIEEFQKGAKKRCSLQVEAWRRDLKWELGTCRKRLSQLKTAFKFCVEDELIPVGLMPIIKLPPKGPARERVLDMKELAALLRECDKPSTEPHIRLAVHLSLRTGQRQGAIHALRWEHIDFENRVIRFRDTEAADERSKKRRTDMPMDDVLFDMLTVAKDNADTEWVLERNGRRVHSVYQGIRAVYKRAGIEGLTRHDLRRSAATMVFRDSGDMKLAANFIGDTEATTARHYAHATAADRIKPVEAISKILDQARRSA